MALAYNSRKYMPWLDGLGFSLQLITLGLGGFLVIKGYMTLGNLVSFNSFLWMIDGPVRQSGWLINDWQRQTDYRSERQRTHVGTNLRAEQLPGIVRLRCSHSWQVSPYDSGGRFRRCAATHSGECCA